LKNILIIGANGDVAQLFFQIAKKLKLKTIGIDLGDQSCEADEFFKFDITSLGQKKHLALHNIIKSVDYVAFCTAEQEASLSLSAMLPLLKAESLLIDVFATKEHYFKTVEEVMAHNKTTLDILSIHTLFKPCMGFKNNNVAIIRECKHDHNNIILTAIEEMGATVIHCDPYEYEAIMTLNQVIPHFFLLAYGKILLNSKIDIKKVLSLSTPLQRSLINLLNRVTSGKSHVYWDIQKNNKKANESRNAYINFLQEIDVLIKNDMFTQYSETFIDINKLLLTSQQDFQKATDFS